MLETEQLSESYETFYQKVFKMGSARVRELPRNEDEPLPNENILQGLWFSAAFGESFKTTRGEKVFILDLGEWNRGAGPDFLNARFLLKGRVVFADVELDPCPQDWEKHGHGENSNFDNVGLHVVFTKPEGEWFTRNSKHEQIPVIVIPDIMLKKAMGEPIRRGVFKGGKCKLPLAKMKPDAIHALMRAAAAYRWQMKSTAFKRTEAIFGRDQALYETLAETLGYRRNKYNMRLLAQRAPLNKVMTDTEAILFGVAGFLTPYLPEKSTPSAAGLHKRLWETWWKRRDEFQLEDERAIQWDMAGIRPANRPERRLAALALAVSKWRILHQLFVEPSKNMAAIFEVFNKFSHAYWSRHVSLPGNPLQTILALMGKERVADFLVNHLLPAEDSENSWRRYLELVAPSRSERVKTISAKLFGENYDAKEYLKYSWQHQALLQLYKDFCVVSTCDECLFPEQMKQWNK